MDIYTKTVSASCGRGKTYSLGVVIKKTQHQRNHLVLMPTKKVIGEFKSDLVEKHGVENVVEITSNTSTSVRKEAIEFFKAAEDTGHVVLMTWQGYQDFPYFNRRENWDVYVDEIPQIDEFIQITVPFNNHHITKHIEIDENLNEAIATLKIKDGCEKEIKKMVERSFDQVSKIFIPLYKALLSDTRDVFVDMTSWNRVFENQKIDESKAGQNEKTSGNRVFFLSMMNPSEWNDVTLMGANIEQSMLYHWFGDYHGVEFSDNNEIINNLRDDSNVVPLSDRLNVSYFLNDRGFSKYFGSKNVPNRDFTVIEKMDMKAVEEFGDQDFLYVANNDHNSEALEGSNKALKIPVIAHGLNTYDEYTNIYFSAALNREPAHIRMLNSLGFDNDLIRTSTAHEVIYQSIMRTALRDPDSQEPVNVIVPDQFSADRLIEIFGGGNKKRIGDMEFKKVKPFTQQDRNKRNQFSKIKDDLFNKDEQITPSGFAGIATHASQQSVNVSVLNKNDRESLHLSFIKENSNQNGFLVNIGTPTSSILLLTFHKEIYDKEPTEFVIEEMMSLDFVRLMKQASETIIDHKDESFMVNSTVFDPSIDPEGYRRQDNFIQSSMMVLDFDGGDLSPEAFEQIFWHDAGKGNKRSFIICNSFSRSKEQPNKYRVFMFYKQPAKSLNEHQAVYDSIVQRIEINGFSEISSKLDKACRTGNQSFYIPCINREHKDQAFFRKYGLSRSREIEQYGINPATYIKTTITPFERVTVMPVNRNGESLNDIEGKIDEVKNQVLHLSSGRHSAFYKLAIELKKLGLSYPEIEFHLKSVEKRIGKTKEQWSKYAMKSVHSYKNRSNQVAA